MHSRFDTEARVAVTQAVDIARELGHSEVGPDHLLLGLLANPRGAAYAALTRRGLELQTAREIVATRHVATVDHHPVDGDTAEAATAATSYDEDRTALRAIGIDLDRVRAAVRSNLGQDLTDGWGSRSERRGRGRGRGKGGARGPRREGGQHHPHDHAHAEGRGRGRRGPRSRRGEGPAFSPELRGLLRDVRHAVLRDRLDADATHDRGPSGRVAGMTGARLLLALTQSDDAVVRQILAGATDLDALRAEAEVAGSSTPDQQQ
jgi:hypothetical protein